MRLQLRTANQGSSLSVRERHRHTGGAAGGVKAREKHKTLVERQQLFHICTSVKENFATDAATTVLNEAGLLLLNVPSAVG